MHLPGVLRWLGLGEIAIFHPFANCVGVQFDLDTALAFALGLFLRFLHKLTQSDFADKLAPSNHQPQRWHLHD